MLGIAGKWIELDLRWGSYIEVRSAFASLAPDRISMGSMMWGAVGVVLGFRQGFAITVWGGFFESDFSFSDINETDRAEWREFLPARF